MRKAVFIFLGFLFLIPFAANAEVKEVRGMLKDIHWLGHDTFKITGEKVIYTDLFKNELPCSKLQGIKIKYVH